MLELNGIRKSFGKIEVLRGVDLQARPGEVHALLGENGAGKSTLMKILCGILQPSEGTIRIDGQDRRFANYDEAIAAGIGIVFQEFSLIPYLNAVENMFLAREIRGPLRLLNKGAMRKSAAMIMSRLAVDVPLDVPVHRAARFPPPSRRWNPISIRCRRGKADGRGGQRSGRHHRRPCARRRCRRSVP